MTEEAKSIHLFDKHSFRPKFPSQIRFEKLEEKLQVFDSLEFISLLPRKKFKRVNRLLLELIEAASGSTFLLPSVIDYLNEINIRQLLDEPISFALFEFWLNLYSELSYEKQLEIRSKIAGKNIPRDDYQVFFPIGMNKSYDGSHFVVAHLSPDIDTMVASFWGWLDAFAAKVGTAQHYWSLPGGPPASPVTELFKSLFGKNAFQALARVATTLSLNAKDLVTQKNLAREHPETTIGALDHGYNEKAVILTNGQDQFLGEWHSSDAELVRQVIILFKSCLRWFESNLQQKLIAFFAKTSPSKEDVPDFLISVFDVKIASSEPAKEFSDKQKVLTHLFLTEVVRLPAGLESSFSELGKALFSLGTPELAQFEKILSELKQSSFFDENGALALSRPQIFSRIEKILIEFDKAIRAIRDFSEKLGIAMQIKKYVLKTPSVHLTTRNDVEDIKLKMKNADFLTVTVPDSFDELFAVGIIRSQDLHKPVLGTVSLRDFCNTDEMRLSSYLSIISVIDHHKSQLKTMAPPLAVLGDAQSCNVLVAEIAFSLNDRYSLGGMTEEEIDTAIKKLQEDSFSFKNGRLMKRLLIRKQAFHNCQTGYFIDPSREYLEYFFFLHAILDDTDLLSKVSMRDVLCVQELLNRIKSLQVANVVETIDFDGLVFDKDFAANAARRLLQNEDLHKIYAEIYTLKEKEVEENLSLSGSNKSSTVFADTKEQNGCCRVGQTKLFSTNIATYTSLRTKIIQNWLEDCSRINKNRPEIDLFLHMISTIPNAEEVYNDKTYNDTKPMSQEDDEMWIWKGKSGYEHLSVFLSAFQSGEKVQHNPMRVEFYGKNTAELQEIFTRNFIKVPMKIVDGPFEESFAVLKYPRGLINSRKAFVSPYLPKSINTLS